MAQDMVIISSCVTSQFRCACSKPTQAAVVQELATTAALICQNGAQKLVTDYINSRTKCDMTPLVDLS